MLTKKSISRFIFTLVLMSFQVSVYAESTGVTELTDNPFLTIDDIKEKLKNDREAIIKKALLEKPTEGSSSVKSAGSMTSGSTSLKVLAVTYDKAILSTGDDSGRVVNNVIDGGVYLFAGLSYRVRIENGYVTLVGKDDGKVFFTGNVSSVYSQSPLANNSKGSQ